MGLSFDQPISADFSIRAFAQRDEENPNGWGLAWYPDHSVAVVKEPREWRKSSYTRFLETYRALSSRMYIAHVRHQTTGGPPTHADTHPFNRELKGRDFCFAHNGTLETYRELPLGRYRPVGQTDSEHVFCHLLDRIAQRGDELTNERSWRWLHEQLIELNHRGKLNCILSDGHRLFCYHDVNAWKGLSLRKVHIVEGQERHFGDPTVELTMESTDPQPFNYGYVVATCPLSDSGWQSFQTGELVVFEGGALRFSSVDERRTL